MQQLVTTLAQMLPEFEPEPAQDTAVLFIERNSKRRPWFALLVQVPAMVARRMGLLGLWQIRIGVI
jgi:hypothetical protein